MSTFKKAITSRFEGGNIVEVDWSQLEIAVLQIESGDKALEAELNDGVDLHSMMTAAIYDTSYKAVIEAIKVHHDALWIERRRQTKRARFALQYGAYPAKISKLTGWDMSFAEHFINQYYARYSGIKLWQDKVSKKVHDTSRPWGVDGTRRGQYTSPSGRRYVFQTYPNNRGVHNFSPNQLKNYPIQGLAADFVGHMVGKLFRKVLDYDLLDEVLLINTIHDSVLLDVHPKYNFAVRVIIDEVYGKAQAGMIEVVQDKRSVNIPLRYEISSGHSWSK